MKPLRKAIKAKAPGLSFERALWADGKQIVVGIDEVGKGAWAGPLTLAAVVVPKDRRIYKVRDSKMLTPAEREEMFDRVADWAEAWAVGHATNAECDELGMSDAQRLAANRAIEGLGLDAEPDAALVDGNWDFIERGNTQTVIKGDAKCLSIAAASLLAKVSRDKMMRQYALHYPGYDLEFNKGYPCPRHRAALRQLGPSAIHRQSWAFMDDIAWSGIERKVREVPQQQLF